MGPYSARGPSSRFYSSASNFPSAGFSSAPPNTGGTPPPRKELLFQRSSGFGSGLLSLPPYASQRYARKDPTGPEGYHYLGQGY